MPTSLGARKKNSQVKIMRETIALPGYEFVEKIAAGVGTIIYRATRTSDNRSVVVKLLSSEHPTIEEIGRLKQEFIITQHLVDCKGVIKAHALEKYKNGFALVLEDLVGTSMKQMLGEPMHLADKLRVGLALANTLAEIHRLGVIHKDIKPSNIL
ncbi:MAG: protein kinase, partial [Okeania sp. SIO2H7]|nr:protein kinase [Okeania sp. SIO2H7]